MWEALDPWEWDSSGFRRGEATSKARGEEGASVQRAHSDGQVSLDCGLRGATCALSALVSQASTPCLFISSHVFITHPSTIPPSNCLSVHLFIYSPAYHPSIRSSTTLLPFHRTSTIHPSIHHPTITIQPSTVIHLSTHHSFIY